MLSLLFMPGCILTLSVPDWFFCDSFYDPFILHCLFWFAFTVSVWVFFSHCLSEIYLSLNFMNLFSIGHSSIFFLIYCLSSISLHFAVVKFMIKSHFCLRNSTVFSFSLSYVAFIGFCELDTLSTIFVLLLKYLELNDSFQLSNI